MWGLRKFTELDFLRVKIEEIKLEIEAKRAAKAEQRLVLEARAEYDSLKKELVEI